MNIEDTQKIPIDVAYPLLLKDFRNLKNKFNKSKKYKHQLETELAIKTKKLKAFENNISVELNKQIMKTAIANKEIKELEARNLYLSRKLIEIQDDNKRTN